MKRILFLCVLMTFVYSLYSQGVTLQFSIRTTTPIKSNAYSTELPTEVCEVAHDVYYNGELLVRKNTPVDTRIEVQKARSRNRVGSITIHFLGVQTVTGRRVFLKDSYSKGGKLRRWRLLPGKNAYIPVGTMYNVSGVYSEQ